jgi:UDP-MurNAc hydroxylase
VTLESLGGDHQENDLAAYSARRQVEWKAFYDLPECSITAAEIASYFARLQRRNKHLLQDFSKTVRLAADKQVWMVRLGELAEDFVIEAEEPFDLQYSLLLSTRILRQILDGVIGWEEALLSLRVRLRRTPDVFDSRLFGLLRYGNEPVQTLKMTREMASTEMMERGDLRMQRFCPHAGEDLAFATICNGEIECPRHHWRWNAQTGECLKGGNLRLRVESVDGAGRTECHSVPCGEAALQPAEK